MSRDSAEVLHRLVRDPRWYAGGLEEALRALTEASSRALGTSRVSVWELVEGGSSIRCACLYDTESGAYQSGARLAVDDCPEYFQAIADARIVAVGDALRDTRTRGLGPGYLEPNRIGAMLDAPIVLDGRMSGVVCHESRHGPRDWSEAERALAASVGDLAALAYQSERRRLAEDALRRREEEMRLALEAARVADWSWDMQTQQIRWSAEVGPLFGRPKGWQPADYEEYLALIHPDDHASLMRAVQEAMDGRGDYYIEHRGFTPAGDIRWFQSRGRVAFDEGGQALAITGVIADHTTRRELESRLVRAERLESLGRLAGGVAHDFNNLLSAIMGSCELLGLQARDEQMRERLSVIERAVDRAAGLTGQLLAFSRQLPRPPRPVNLTETLRSSLELLERVLGADITLDVHAPEPAWILADPTQLEQIVINLSVNARDAMPDGGRLSFRLGERVREGVAYAELVVRDTGSGIPPENLERVFEPFYTTKTDQSGTGLGLATCHGIVHQYGGRITVESQLGQGTTFWIELPKTLPGDATPPESASRFVESGKRHHVLVLEDDPDLADILCEVVQRDGHGTTHFTNGDEAMAWLAEGHSPTAMISDVVLEGARGTEVILSAQRLLRDIHILLITGYAPEAVPAALSDVPMLTKPFRSDQVHRWLASI